MTELTDERLRQIIAHAETVEKWQGPELLAIVRELLDLRSRPPTAAEAGAAVLVEEIGSALNQFRHCQRQGPWWFTNGEPALRAMTERWLNKADDALAKMKTALASPPIETEGREISEEMVERGARALAGHLFDHVLEGDAESEWYRLADVTRLALTAALNQERK